MADNNVVPFEQTSTIFRTLPHSIEAEQAVLSAILTDNRNYDAVSQFLRPEHFAHIPHQLIFEECGKVISAGNVADPVTLKPLVTSAGFPEPDGQKYLAGLIQPVAPSTARAYARLILDLAHKRDMVAIGEALAEGAYTASVATPASALRDEAEGRLSELMPPDEAQEDDTLGYLEARYRDPGSLMGVTTGFADLDRLLSGFQPGQLVLIAGRPSMGKTSLACCMARRARVPTAFFTLEQSSREIRMKMIADMADVPLTFMREGRYREEQQWHRVVEATQQLGHQALYIDESSQPTAEAIRGKLRALVRKRGIKLAIIDQLTHIQPPKGDNLAYQIGAISRSLKATAKDLGIPIVLLHQLNRAVESRDDKRPTLRDLRDSGALEQDADVVLFVYREAYYLERTIPDEPDPGDYEGGEGNAEYNKALTKRTRMLRRLERLEHTAEIICAKQRMGPIGTVTLYYHGGYSRFADRAREGEMI